MNTGSASSRWLRRVWAPIGQRPTARVQHRFRWRYLVGFVHPASGRTVWHLASGVSIPIFEAELDAFAHAVGAGPTANRRKMRQASSESPRAGTPEDAARLSNLLQICAKPRRTTVTSRPW